jgi:serine/threonine protein kinase
LGNEQFNVIKLLGEGGFARVYKAKSLQNDQIWAIKVKVEKGEIKERVEIKILQTFQYENPPCPWEVYICASLKHRISPEFLHSVMQVRDAYVFSNASAIVYDYCPHGTLLVCSNGFYY